MLGIEVISHMHEGDAAVLLLRIVGVVCDVTRLLVCCMRGYPRARNKATRARVERTCRRYGCGGEDDEDDETN